MPSLNQRIRDWFENLMLKKIKRQTEFRLFGLHSDDEHGNAHVRIARVYDAMSSHFSPALRGLDSTLRRAMLIEHLSIEKDYSIGYLPKFENIHERIVRVYDFNWAKFPETGSWIKRLMQLSRYMMIDAHDYFREGRMNLCLRISRVW